MSRGKGHIPIRTCISCNTRRKKGDLVRLILNDGGIVVRDETGNRPGRGAYVCSNESCISSLKTSKRLKRAFRTGEAVSVHPGLIRVEQSRKP